VPKRLVLAALIAPLALAALTLTGCAASADGSEQPVAEGSPSADSSEQQEPDAQAQSGFSAGPECDAYVAAKNDSLGGTSQRATQVSVDQLPFTLANNDVVLCVAALAEVDSPEQPLGFEIAVNAHNGEGYNTFAMSPDLTYTQCATIEPQGCFTDTSGNVVVVGGEGQEVLVPYFPDAQPTGVGVFLIGG